MGTFPSRVHIIEIVGCVMIVMIFNTDSALAGGIVYTLGYLFNMAALATLVVFFVNVIFTKIRSVGLGEPDV